METPALAPSLNQLKDHRSQLLNQQLVQHAMQLFGAGAGAGLVARGAQGLYNMGRRTFGTPKTHAPPVVTLPLPMDEEKQGGDRMAQLIQRIDPSGKIWCHDCQNKLPKCSCAETKEAGVLEQAGNFIGGGSATTLAGHPMALPVSLAAAGGGAMGGWHLMDYVLDRQRKAELEGELNKAKQQFGSTLLAAHHKQASDLGKDLDQLFDLLTEKQANLTDAVTGAANSMLPDGDTAGKLTGAMLVPAGALALASGALTYDWANGRRQQSLLRSAMAKRQREKQLSQPLPIFAQPIAASGSMNGKPSESAMQGDPLDRTA